MGDPPGPRLDQAVKFYLSLIRRRIRGRSPHPGAHRSRAAQQPGRPGCRGRSSRPTSSPRPPAARRTTPASGMAAVTGADTVTPCASSRGATATRPAGGRAARRHRPGTPRVSSMSGNCPQSLVNRACLDDPGAARPTSCSSAGPRPGAPAPASRPADGEPAGPSQGDDVPEAVHSIDGGPDVARRPSRPAAS